MKTMTLVLCEGAHDVAFLYRILKTTGFTSFNEPLRKFPPPIGDLLIEEVKEANVEQLKIDEVKNRLLPREVLHADSTYLFFYAIGGDAKSDLRVELVRSVYDFIAQDEDEISLLGDDTELSVIYFFDADNKGVAKRLEEIGLELRRALSYEGDIILQNGSRLTIKGLHIGGYVFSADGEKGRLEDILIPMMKGKNEAIFSEAEQFLKNRNENRLRALKIEMKEGKVTEHRNKNVKFDFSKSLIGTAGQLQRSGKSNVVIIRESDYLTLKKINESKECQEIIAFFKAF